MSQSFDLAGAAMLTQTSAFQSRTRSAILSKMRVSLVKSGDDSLINAQQPAFAYDKAFQGKASADAWVPTGYGRLQQF